MITFEGPNGVQTYRVLAIKHGLKLYAKTGIWPNRDWNPKAMLQAAGRITGKTYKRKDMAQAISDLEAWVKANGRLG